MPPSTPAVRCSCRSRECCTSCLALPASRFSRSTTIFRFRRASWWRDARHRPATAHAGFVLHAAAISAVVKEKEKEKENVTMVMVMLMVQKMAKEGIGTRDKRAVTRCACARSMCSCGPPPRMRMRMRMRMRFAEPGTRRSCRASMRSANGASRPRRRPNARAAIPCGRAGKRRVLRRRRCARPDGPFSA